MKEKKKKIDKTTKTTKTIFCIHFFRNNLEKNVKKT